MHPAELRQLLQNEIDLFYEGGQKDPMPVLARLKEAAAAELTFPARLPSPPEPEAPAGWLLVYQEGRPDLQAMSLPAMIRRVRELPALPRHPPVSGRTARLSDAGSLPSGLRQ